MDKLRFSDLELAYEREQRRKRLGMLTDGHCGGTDPKSFEFFDHSVYCRAFDLQLLLHRIDGFVQ